MTFIKYTSGANVYYSEAKKVGRYYVVNGERATKSRGYFDVEEISEITEEMKDEMTRNVWYS